MQEGLRADPDIFLAAVFFLHVPAKLVPALKRQRLLVLPVVSQLLQALSTGGEHGLSLGSTLLAELCGVGTGTGASTEPLGGSGGTGLSCAAAFLSAPSPLNTPSSPLLDLVLLFHSVHHNL